MRPTACVVSSIGGLRVVSADYYSVANRWILFASQQMTRGFVAALDREGRFPLADQRIADIGCGWGTWLVDLESWGARQSNLAGLDLDPARVEFAARRLPQADLRSGNAASLPWPDESFDVVLLGTVLSSVLDVPVRRRIADEVTRVLAPGGMVLWYDFFVDNPKNPNVRGIRAGRIRELFPSLDVSLRVLHPRAAGLAAPCAMVRGPAAPSSSR